MKKSIYFAIAFCISLSGYGQMDISEILLENSEYFEEESKNFSISIGLGSDVKLDSIVQANDRISPKVSIPMLRINFEKQVWKNVGISAGTSYKKWTVPVFDYKYHYFSFDLKGNYHFNIHEDLDPYIGIGASYRRLIATNSINSIGNGSLNLAFVVGARYYITDDLGFFVAIGNDSLSTFRLGASFYFQ